MKIAFLGSHNLRFCQESIKAQLDIEDFTSEIHLGGYFFKDNYMSFYDNIADSNYILIDFLTYGIDYESNYRSSENEYQRLIWYIHSICPNAQIHLLNFFYDYEPDDAEAKTFCDFLLKLNFKNCHTHFFKDHSCFFKKRDHYMKKIMFEMFNEEVDFNEGANVEPEVSEHTDSNIESIIKKLKSKKEFETIHENV